MLVVSVVVFVLLLLSSPIQSSSVRFTVEFPEEQINALYTRLDMGRYPNEIDGVEQGIRVERVREYID